jgi:hypothetical protein
MVDINDFRDILVNLLVSDHETIGEPIVPDDKISTVRDSLVFLILDADALGEHWRWLGAKDAKKRHRSILPDDRFQNVLDGGLDVLGADELARLALNPVALSELADMVSEELPNAWLPRIQDAAAELVRRHGVTFDPVEPPDFDEGDTTADDHELLMMGSLDEGRPERPSWKFTLSAEDCRWEPGLPADLDEDVARVLVERDETTGSLTVSPEGFMGVGVLSEVEVAWTSDDGVLRATGRVVDNFVPVLLQPFDPAPPAAGDRLEITKRSRPTAASPGWAVHATLTFA